MEILASIITGIFGLINIWYADYLKQKRESTGKNILIPRATIEPPRSRSQEVISSPSKNRRIVSQIVFILITYSVYGLTFWILMIVPADSALGSLERYPVLIHVFWIAVVLFIIGSSNNNKLSIQEKALYPLLVWLIWVAYTMSMDIIDHPLAHRW